MVNRVVGSIVLLLVLMVSISEPLHAQKRKKKKDKDEVEHVEVHIYDRDTLVQPVPLQRRYWHENKIDEFQKRADLSDGIEDGKIVIEDDTIFTRLLTEAIIEDVDQLQIMIENFPADSVGWDARTENNVKLLYLRAVAKMLRYYNVDPQPDGYNYKRLVNNMHDVLIADFENRLSEFIHNNVNMYTLDNIGELVDTGTADREFIYREMGKREPLKMLDKLSEFATHSYACDIIAEAAKIAPNKVFNYATSTTYLRAVVEQCPDPLVQAIVRIARYSKSPLKAMPFLNDIYTGRRTIQQIDEITSDPDLFYQNLVRLKLENVQLGGDTYTSELQYRGLRYVREMNDLHEEKAAVRFRCINGMPPEVLYFIMVYGQNEIYTSSFLGTFNRMVERLGPMGGDQLLEKVHRDKFRTFIRMCAGYNTLTDFLGTMDSMKRMSIMKDFIANLEEGKQDDLEGAVDVADAFGSIRDTALADFLRNEVIQNYERCKNINSRKGIIIYGLLGVLFESTKSEEDLGGRLKLPPITMVPYDKLVTGKDKIVYEQFFFYGDEDGRASYNSWLTNFRDKTKWSVVKDQYWTTITALKGKPMVVYANMPLEEPEDEVAIDTLCKFLVAKGIQPTVMVHRGHSYHLPLTLERLQKETKIVMLGSCGGYHNLSTVLTKSPNANIISSKQTGAMSVNEPIIKSINDQISAGEDVNWITTWRGLTGYFDERRGVQKEMFDDYVPPHKNLGAIFIKAYRRLFNADI